MSARPLAVTPLAVSMGDPAGVGLEIAARAFAMRAPGAHQFFLIADADAYARAASRIGASQRIARISAPSEASVAPADALPVLHLPLSQEEIPGRPDPRNAAAITGTIAKGVALAAGGEAAALVTLPIAKAPLYEAGFPFPGHTEYLAHLTEALPYAGERGPVMMLACDALKVALVTIHVPLADVRLTQARIVSVGRVVAQALQSHFAIAAPRIALAGLNPHAGEGGGLGREEIEIINPAAAALRAEGHDVRDAASADTLFHAEARAKYDAVIAMYHDQGLIPIKTLDFWGGVNVTLGLPIIRTSPDHGAGFDIAGRGLARPDSFIAALRLARAMAEKTSA
ncbi:MAG: 4-hydroxythreonine-4-phosphate dehydrogenase PdxA [Hyphomonadaceae bacterium]